MVAFGAEAPGGKPGREVEQERGRGNLSDILGGFAPMRWLLIGLLLSLGALLFAAAGVARHIWLQRKQHGRETLAAREASQETDVEGEP
jgi:hypothetical protein